MITKNGIDEVFVRLEESSTVSDASSFRYMYVHMYMPRLTVDINLCAYLHLKCGCGLELVIRVYGKRG